VLKVLFPVTGPLKYIKIQFQHIAAILMWVGRISSNQRERLDQRFCVVH